MQRKLRLVESLPKVEDRRPIRRAMNVGRLEALKARHLIDQKLLVISDFKDHANYRLAIDFARKLRGKVNGTELFDSHPRKDYPKSAILDELVKAAVGKDIIVFAFYARDPRLVDDAIEKVKRDNPNTYVIVLEARLDPKKVNTIKVGKSEVRNVQVDLVIPRINVAFGDTEFLVRELERILSNKPKNSS